MGTRFAQRNNVVLGNIPMKPPFLVIYFPQAGLSAAVPVRSLMRVASTVKSAEVIAGNVQ
jgi:thiol:disulfide interchange protein DsbG